MGDQISELDLDVVFLRFEESLSLVSLGVRLVTVRPESTLENCEGTDACTSQDACPNGDESRGKTGLLEVVLPEAY